MNENFELGTEIVGETSEGRSIIKNPDGTFSTELKVGISDERINGGKETQIPTIFNGKQVSVEEAIEIIVANDGKDPDTGRKLEGFDSLEEAEVAGKKRLKFLNSELERLGLEK